MRGPGTLRGRLALAALAASVVWVFVLTLLFNVVLGAQLRDQADGLLRTRASAAASTIVTEPGGGLAVREPSDDAALDSGVWIYRGAVALERPAARTAAQRAADALAGRGTRYAEIGGPAPVRLYARPVLAGGSQVGTVVTATSLAPYRRTARLALLGSVALAVLLLAGVYLVTRRIVARALRPVAAMAQQAALWSAHDISQRFGDASRAGELRELAGNLDSVLDHIAAVLRHERELSAELSHELKTPLTLIIAENEWLSSRPRSPEDRAQAHDTIAATAERMNHLLDTLLVEAAHHVTETPGRCALAPVLRTVAEGARTDAPGHPDVSLQVPEDLSVGTAGQVVERILAPLMANAIRHAHTRVAIAAGSKSGRVEIVVADDGDGVPPEFRDHLFEPGRRADPGDGHAGVGLGLALARRLARSAGGDVTLTGGPAGAHFLVTLPRA